MIHTIQSEDITLRFKVEGTGTPVVLLHGYLEALEIWDEFSNALSKWFKVISIDLPGHGGSANNNETNNMEFMADGVFAVLQELKIEKCVLVGHSMGGYATLAFVEKFPERLLGYCLFHSSPFADNEEKKANRQREIELIKQGKKEQIVKPHIHKVFATDNLERFTEALEKTKKIALKTSDEGIISVLGAMMTRPERSELLDNDLPKLFILGKKDNYIAFDTMFPVLKNRKNGKVAVFENSGHMGFIEEQEKAIEVMKEFVMGSSSPS